MSNLNNNFLAKNNNAVRDYLLKDKLGIGSYGVVYKVQKKSDKQFYVLKQISLFNMNKSQVEEVKNESKILASLNSSFIVKYYDSFIETNNLNIIMEYCDGGDLANYMNITNKSGKTLSEEKIWRFFIQITCGLAVIHNQKVLHRDLKSLNIFLTKEEKVKIGDLGVAKLLNQTNFARTFIGTPYYLSPEICEEKPYNDKSDVWALGCILYEMATFKHPFNATNQGALVLKILRGKYDPINNKDYSNELKRMVDILLEKNHFKRPAIVDIIKNPIFLSKAKQSGMTDIIYSTASDLNISLDGGGSFKEVSSNVNPNVNIPSEIVNNKRPSSEIKSKNLLILERPIDNPIKNIKLEFGRDSSSNQSNHNSEKKSDDPSKRLIQMNVPKDFKKQLHLKKEKKEQIVKGVISASNMNNNFMKKVPIKIKREETPKKESGSNFNVVNINGNILKQQKMKEVSNKISEFDSRLNNPIISKPVTPDVKKRVIQHHKRASQSETEECIIEQFSSKYKVTNANEKLMDKADVREVEKAKMVIPNPKSNEGLKSTNAFLKDNKNCTNFFKDVLKEEDFKNIVVNYDKYDINHFVSDLNKKSSGIFDKRISILSDFANKGVNNSQINLQLTPNVVINSNNPIGLQIASNTPKNKISNNLTNNNSNNTPNAKLREECDTVPLYVKDMNLNFQVYEHNDLNNYSRSNDQIDLETFTPIKDVSSFVKSTDINTDNCQNNQSFESADVEDYNMSEGDDEENHSNDDEEIEAVENVSVIKKEKEAESNVTTVKETERELKELLEYKNKFEMKINFYKEESKKTSCDADFNKIFQYYLDISENQGDSDELSIKIENKIKELIPVNYFEFIQNFYNLIYYEIQLDNVKKEIEVKKLNN